MQINITTVTKLKFRRWLVFGGDGQNRTSEKLDIARVWMNAI